MPHISSHSYKAYSAALILGILLFRIIALVLSPIGLHGDEAQYWSWAQDLDWGYFSKPPMIAWVIATSTAIFGDAEWAARLLSPLLHAVIGIMMFLTGRALFDARTGFWALLLYYVMPAVTLSSGLISTDVPLLLCWICGLYALVKLRESPKSKWALTLGITLGLGVLSKYAMLFFLPPLILMLWKDAPTRKALLSRNGIMASLIAAAIIAPNIWWNVNNGFATVTHTAANTNYNGLNLQPLELLEFWVSQMGVFGPITFVFYLLALIATWRGKLCSNAKWLSVFVLVPLLVISVQALQSRANANWAVTSYVGGALLTAHYICHSVRKLWFAKTGIWVNVALGAFAMTAALLPSFADSAGLANALKRTRAWPETVTAIREAANHGHEGHNYTALALDNRLVFYDLTYYGAEQLPPLRMWLETRHITHHAEATAPLTAQHGDPVLIVSQYREFETKFRADFDRLEHAGQINIDLGGGKNRLLTLWAGYGYTPTTTRDE